MTQPVDFLTTLHGVIEVTMYAEGIVPPTIHRGSERMMASSRPFAVRSGFGVGSLRWMCERPVQPSTGKVRQLGRIAALEPSGSQPGRSCGIAGRVAVDGYADGGGRRDSARSLARIRAFPARGPGAVACVADSFDIGRWLT